jgi:hypothetical protein
MSKAMKHGKVIDNIRLAACGDLALALLRLAQPAAAHERAAMQACRAAVQG